MKRNPRLNHIRKRIPKEVKLTIDRSFELVDRIDAVLQRQGKTRRDLAIALNKSESEVSKWMRGTHNFTIKTISKLEIALGESIISVSRSRGVIPAMSFRSGESEMKLKIYYYLNQQLRDSVIFTPQVQPISTNELIGQFN
jgi:transcriptional regulator with XRE-family HTH domain